MPFGVVQDMSGVGEREPTARKRATATLLLLTGLGLLAGCSAADTPAAAPASESATATATAEDGCGDVSTTVRDHLKSADVRTVTVNGQCTNVTIDTELDDENNADGKQLCETAAEVAYIGDINSVTVVSKSGTELSVGIPGMKCLP